MSAKDIHTYIERLGNLLRNEMRRLGGEHGLQPVQIEALHYLSICNRYSDSLMGVVEYLGQTKGTVSQSLKVLERNGLISRTPDPDDKRKTHLHITRDGDRVLKAINPAPSLASASDALGKVHEGRVIEQLRSLLQTIQQANGMKTFGVCRTCRYNQPLSDGGALCGLTDEKLNRKDITLICREHADAA